MMYGIIIRTLTEKHSILQSFSFYLTKERHSSFSETVFTAHGNFCPRISFSGDQFFAQWQNNCSWHQWTPDKCRQGSKERFHVAKSSCVVVTYPWCWENHMITIGLLNSMFVTCSLCYYWSLPPMNNECYVRQPFSEFLWYLMLLSDENQMLYNQYNQRSNKSFLIFVETGQRPDIRAEWCVRCTPALMTNDNINPSISSAEQWCSMKRQFINGLLET